MNNILLIIPIALLVTFRVQAQMEVPNSNLPFADLPICIQDSKQTDWNWHSVFSFPGAKRDKNRHFFTMLKHNQGHDPRGTGLNEIPPCGAQDPYSGINTATFRNRMVLHTNQCADQNFTKRIILFPLSFHNFRS